MTSMQQNERYSAGVLRGGHMLAGVEVPVLVSESHQQSAQATGVAMESGTNVTDHVIHQPRTLTVAFAATNAGDGSGRARDVYESFVQMMDAGEPVEIATEHALYRDMIITGLSHEHAAPYKGALSGSMTLQEAKQVEVVTVGRPPELLEPAGEETAVPWAPEETDRRVRSAAILAKITAKTMSATVDAGRVALIPLERAAEYGLPDAAKLREIMRNYVRSGR